jgi:hypothetical protein
MSHSPFWLFRVNNIVYYTVSDRFAGGQEVLGIQDPEDVQPFRVYSKMGGEENMERHTIGKLNSCRLTMLLSLSPHGGC